MALDVVFEMRGKRSVVAALSGRLDSNTYQECQELLAPYLEENPRVLVFDLQHLEFISSAGLRVVLAAQKVLNEKGGKVVMAHMQPQIAKVFEIADVLPETDIFDSLESADAYLKAIQKKELLKGQDWGAIKDD